jgi:Domain of unknown function (DUF4375)
VSSSKQVSQILREMSGQDAIMAIDNLLAPIFYSEPEKLSDEEKVIVYIGELEREVNNGGFSQFFFNTSGDYTEEVIQSLQKIGSIKFLSLAESAKAQFPNFIVPADKAERRQILEEIDEDANNKWNDLDNEFYQYEEDIYSLMSSYIERNIEKFR